MLSGLALGVQGLCDLSERHALEALLGQSPKSFQEVLVILEGEPASVQPNE